MAHDDIIRKTIFIHASPSRTWRVLTDPQLVRQWISDTGVDVRSDWKTGSPIVFKGNLYSTETPYEDHGTILSFEPERVLRYNYRSALSLLPDAPENYPVIEFRLRDENDGTSLTLTQSRLPDFVTMKHWWLYWNVTLGLVKRLSEQQ